MSPRDWTPDDNPPEVQTLPHCTGCTEPGAVTHQQETAEHIHDMVERYRSYTANLETTHIETLQQLTEANATIAALRDALVFWTDGQSPALAQPIPPAAAKLLAERDAGRALYEAVRGTAIEFEDGDVQTAYDEAVEAYRKGVE